jgi:hypothetical protein
MLWTPFYFSITQDKKPRYGYGLFGLCLCSSTTQIFIHSFIHSFLCSLPPKLKMASSSSSSTCFLCINHNYIPSFKSPTTLKPPSTLTTNSSPHFFPRLRLQRASPKNKNSTTTDDIDDDSLETTSPPKPLSLLPHFR